MEQRFSMGRGGGALTVHEEGPRAVLEAEQPDDKRGLYKAYLRGRSGRLLLGTLMPEGGRLCLKRTFSIDELKRKGCWPVVAAEAELAYSFQGGRPSSGQSPPRPSQGVQNQPGSGPPPGWSREREPCRLLGEPFLRHAAREISWGLVRRGPGGFDLALPYQADKRFPITPIFCFAHIETIGAGRFAVYRLNEKGMPAFRDGE